MTSIVATQVDQLASSPIFCADSLLFESSDVDEVQAKVGKAFKPHTLNFLKSGGARPASMQQVRLHQFSLNRLAYQHEATIDPGRLDDFFLVQVPVQGTAEIRCGNKQFVSSPGVASLVSPTLPLCMHWDSDCPHLILRFERERMERHCARHFGLAQGGAVEFDPELRLDTPGGRYFIQLLQALAEGMATPDHPLHHALAFEPFEASIFNALIYGQASNLDRDRPVASIAPYFVKRIEEFIRTHAAEPLTIERLAEHAAVSVRTLFAGFHRYRGVSPMAFVREVRLERARADLMSDDPSLGSVTDIALKWGFTHLGRFAVEYKRRFGESPSATLRFRAGL